MTAPKDRARVVAVMANGITMDALLDADWRTAVSRSALAALEAAGLRVVPVEATQAQVDAMMAGLDVLDDYRRAVAASPYAPPPEDPA